MKSQNHHDSSRDTDKPLRQSGTTPSDPPVRHQPVWRFLLNQLLGPATRVHYYRQLSARMIGETLDELDGRRCR